MSGREIVYVVTSGEYSDYGIRAIFSTRELADAYIAECNRHPREAWDEGETEDADEHLWGYDERIEEWPLDKMVGAKGAHVVVIDEDGAVLESKFSEATWPQSGPSRSGWTRAQMSARNYRGAGSPLRIWGFGQTEEHARRSAEQYRREYLTSGEAS